MGKKIAYISARNLSKWDWLALMRKLPDDAVIENFDYHFAFNAVMLLIRSETFPDTPEGTVHPELTLAANTDDALAESRIAVHSVVKDPVVYLPPNVRVDIPPRITVECICDMAYTGLRTHRRDCPKAPK